MRDATLCAFYSWEPSLRLDKHVQVLLDLRVIETKIFENRIRHISGPTNYEGERATGYSSSTLTDNISVCSSSLVHSSQNIGHRTERTRVRPSFMAKISVCLIIWPRIRAAFLAPEGGLALIAFSDSFTIILPIPPPLFYPPTWQGSLGSVYGSGRGSGFEGKANKLSYLSSRAASFWSITHQLHSNSCFPGRV